MSNSYLGTVAFDPTAPPYKKKPQTLEEFLAELKRTWGDGAQAEPMGSEAQPAPGPAVGQAPVAAPPSAAQSKPAPSYGLTPEEEAQREAELRAGSDPYGDAQNTLGHSYDEKHPEKAHNSIWGALGKIGLAIAQGRGALGGVADLPDYFTNEDDKREYEKKLAQLAGLNAARSDRHMKVWDDIVKGRESVGKGAKDAAEIGKIGAEKDKLVVETGLAPAAQEDKHAQSTKGATNGNAARIYDEATHTWGWAPNPYPRINVIQGAEGATAYNPVTGEATAVDSGPKTQAKPVVIGETRTETPVDTPEVNAYNSKVDEITKRYSEPLQRLNSATPGDIRQRKADMAALKAMQAEIKGLGKPPSGSKRVEVQKQMSDPNKGQPNYPENFRTAQVKVAQILALPEGQRAGEAARFIQFLSSQGHLRQPQLNTIKRQLGVK